MHSIDQCSIRHSSRFNGISNLVHYIFDFIDVHTYRESRLPAKPIQYKNVCDRFVICGRQITTISGTEFIWLTAAAAAAAALQFYRRNDGGDDEDDEKHKACTIHP